MLLSLSIRNFILIQHLHINFQKGFSVITGETGAGKSILIGALSLLSGKRTDINVLQNRTKKCIIEGTFRIQNNALEKLFQQHDWDYDDEIIIRKEISTHGKSRVFVNDSPALLQDVKTLTHLLIDIHSQHQNLLLNDKSFQLDMIDNIANSKSLKKTYTNKYFVHQKKINELEAVKKLSQQHTANLDYYQYQLSQLKAADLQSGEQENLEEEQKKLSHMEEIRSALYRSTQLLDEAESTNILSMLSAIIEAMHKIEGLMPNIRTLNERLESSRIELKDINDEIGHLNESLFYDPERLEKINERLYTFYSLQQKHKRNSIDGLIKFQKELEKKINAISFYNEKIDRLNKEITTSKIALQKLADLITNARKKSFSLIEKELIRLLQQLGIAHVQIQIYHEKYDELTPDGQDHIQFLFTANRNTKLQPIDKIASGGEISRLMMCMKYFNSDLKNLPTIVFDEIDTGLSGEVARKTGTMMKEMAENRQILCITHLPQIAGQSNQHFYVYKIEGKKKTTIHLKQLTKHERVQELAKMLSGEKLTDAAIKHAEELLG